MQKFDNIKISLNGCIKGLSDCIKLVHSPTYEMHSKNLILSYHLLEEKINNIQILHNELQINLAMITRTKMKCAFFGKTSNGKSAVINALLHKKVLPSGLGRTTSCFITVEGCQKPTGYFLDKNGNHISLDELKNFASEYDETSYGIDSEIPVFFPISQFSLLEHNIQLLDSPGCDVSVNKDSWIAKYCLDADVFVYVVDATSTLCNTEREFFRKVKQKIGKPSIFILLNKWDQCRDNDTDEISLRKQHIETIKSFLEVDMETNFDPEKRTFCVSATENLGDYTPEFKRFLEFLKSDMTRRAVVTKFKPHVDKGIAKITSVIGFVDFILNFENRDIDETHSSQDYINNLIENAFKEIERKSLNEIASKCQSFSATLFSNIQNNKPTSDEINTFIEYHFTEIFKNLQKSVETILPIIRARLEEYSNVRVDETLMDNYMPSSFEEVMSPYKTKLKKKKINSEIEKAYNELDSRIRPYSSGEIYSYTNKWPVDFGISVFKSMLCGIGNTLSTIVSTIKNAFTGIDHQSVLKKSLTDKIEDFLTKTAKDIIKECKDDILDRINGYTNTFLLDCKEISELMNTLKNLKIRLKRISEALEVEKRNIASMEQ